VGKRCQSILFPAAISPADGTLRTTSEKARLRTGQSFRIIVIQEAGLDGFWIHRALQNEGIESHVVDAASIATSRRRRRAKTDKIDGEALVRALLAYKRGEPRSVQWSRRHSRRGRPPPPLPRAQSANRRESATRQSYQRIIIQQGIPDISRCAATGASGWKNSKPATAAPSLSILKRSSTVSSIGLNFFSTDQDVEAARDALLAVGQTAKPAPAAMLLDIRGIDQNSPPYSGRRAIPTLLKTDGRSQRMRVWPRHPGRAARSIENRECPKPAPATANNIDPARLAMAAQSAALSSQPLVSRTGQPQRGPPAQDNDRGTGAKATGRALEIRDRRVVIEGVTMKVA